MLSAEMYNPKADLIFTIECQQEKETTYVVIDNAVSTRHYAFDSKLVPFQNAYEVFVYVHMNMVDVYNRKREIFNVVTSYRKTMDKYPVDCLAIGVL